MKRREWRRLRHVRRVLIGACAMSGLLHCGVEEELGNREGGDASDEGSSPTQGGSFVVSDSGTGTLIEEAGGALAAIDAGIPSQKAGASDGGSANIAACESTCSDEAVGACNVELSTANLECKRLCARGATSSQRSCLMEATCSTLTQALASGSAICEIGEYEAGPALLASCESVCNSAVFNATSAGCYFGAGLGTDEQCAALCAESPTQGQIDCLMKATCLELISALDGDAGTVCGFLPDNQDAG